MKRLADFSPNQLASLTLLGGILSASSPAPKGWMSTTTITKGLKARSKMP